MFVQCKNFAQLTVLFLNLNADTKVRLCQGRHYRLRSAAEPTLTGDSFMLSTQRRYSIQGALYLYQPYTDHCPPLPDICTSTHRACSGCSVLAVSGASSCGRISLLLAVRTSFISTRPAGTFLRQSTCCRSRDVPEFQGLVIINKHLLIGTKPTTFYSFITPALHSHSYPHT